MKKFIDVVFYGLMAVCLFAAVAHGGSKAPTTDVRISVAEMNARGMVLVPVAPATGAEKYIGKSCLVQVFKKTSVFTGEFETVKVIPHFVFEPIEVEGNFVSGGKETVRVARLVWLNVDEETTGE